ncbi:MAG: hypothetical protein J6L83_05410 [Clostridia bacterium]|nr:hypothetical protein [Clostridia bacterium]
MRYKDLMEALIVVKNVISEISGLRKFSSDRSINMNSLGVFADSVRFIERNQLLDIGLWRKFVEQYRTQPDGKDGRWRCEYWGKMMRGADISCRQRGKINWNSTKNYRN